MPVSSVRLAPVAVAVVMLAASLLSSRIVQADEGFDGNGQCVGDANGDGQITVDEILMAVHNALTGCQFMPVTLQFRGMVGSQPFECGQLYHGIGTTKADFVPADFRFYIHNIRLVNTDGKEVPLRLDQDGIWQYRDVALLDFENKVQPCNDGTPQLNSVVHGTIAPGQYTGVRFLLGVPFALGHGDEATAPSPLNLDGMFWSWQDGYKFLRIDTAFDNVRVHVGSTMCVLGAHNVVSGCGRMNIGAVNLDHFDPSTNVIVADMAAILADSDINANQVNTEPGCQSEPNDLDCVPMFLNLGINFSDGSPNPTSQKFFHVE